MSNNSNDWSKYTTQQQQLLQQQQQQLLLQQQQKALLQQQYYYQTLANQGSHVYDPLSGSYSAAPAKPNPPVAQPALTWRDVVAGKSSSSPSTTSFNLNPTVNQVAQPSQYQYQQYYQQLQQQQQQQQPPPPPPQQQQSSGNSWELMPKGVQDYVLRAYQTCQSKAQKDAMERSLKSIITMAVQSGALHTRRWETFPIPPVVAESSSHAVPAFGSNNYVFPSLSLHSSYPTASPSHSLTREDTEKKKKVSEMLNNALTASKADKPQTKKEKKKAQAEEKKKKKEEALKSAKKKPALSGELSEFAKEDLLGKNRTRFLLDRPLKRAAVSRPELYDEENLDWDNMRVVGTCEVLEKRYLRLTSAPDPSTVRPVRVLEKTLSLLLEKWSKKALADDENILYVYISDQFRSMRQDLTVQNIKTQFCVRVYETNARVALEVLDMHEYNACQTQLWALYQLDKSFCANLEEFTAYRILYFCFTRNDSELSAMYGSSFFAGFESETIRHAELVRRAYDDCNWVSFRRLHKEAPFMSANLMAKMLGKFRVAVLLRLLKSRGKVLSLHSVRRALDVTGGSDEAELENFVSEYIVSAEDAEGFVDIPATLRTVSEKGD